MLMPVVYFPLIVSAQQILVFRRYRRANLTVESVIVLLAGYFQLPMGKIFGAVAAIAPALKHEKIFGSGNDPDLEKARPVNLSFKTPFFIKHWFGVAGFC